MIKRIIYFLENSRFNLKTFIIAFLTLISTRLLIEALLLGIPIKSLESFLSLFIHTFSFFLLTYILVFFLLIFLTKEKPKKIASFLLWGFWIIILPPIIDKVVFQGDTYKSFYLFDSVNGLIVRFFTFFGDNPNWGITWGTRVNILIALIFIGWYVFLKTKKITKTFLGILISYCVFFILSGFPSIVVYVLEIKSIHIVSQSTVAGYFMTPFSVFNIQGSAIDSFLARKLALIYLPIILFLSIGFLSWINKNKALVLIKNIRFPQIFFNLGLLFIGLGLGYFFNKEVFSLNFFSVLVVFDLCLVVFLVWLSSVFINDLSDISVDKISNKNRPLIKKVFSKKEYYNYSWISGLFAILLTGLISPVITLITLSYILLTVNYSCNPFRLKRFPLIAGVLISLTSLNFLIIGFLIFSENQTLNYFPWRIYWFLFLAYLLTTPLKDLKDVAGDKINQTYTLPVLIGKEKTRLIIASSLLSLYLLSVYILNKQELFLIAIVFGVINFVLINNQKVDEKKLNPYVLFLVFIYGIIVVRIIF